MKPSTYSARIPTYAISYLINADDSGIDEQDARNADSFMEYYYTLAEKHNATVIINPNDGDEYFTSRPAFGLPCNVTDCTITILIFSYNASFNRFTLEMTAEDAHAASAPGPAEATVAEFLTEEFYARQLDAIPADKIRNELNEYGAWSEEELQDDTANRARILWIAAGEINEEIRSSKKA